MKLKSQRTESVGHSSTCVTCTEVKQTPEFLHQQIQMIKLHEKKYWVTGCAGCKRVTEVKVGYKMQILLDTTGIVPATPSHPSLFDIYSKI